MVKIVIGSGLISVGILFSTLHMLARQRFKSRWAAVQPRTSLEVVDCFGTNGHLAEAILREWEEQCGIPSRHLRLETPLRSCLWPNYGVFSQPILDCCGDVLNPSEKEGLASCEILISEVLKRFLDKHPKT